MDMEPRCYRSVCRLLVSHVAIDIRVSLSAHAHKQSAMSAVLSMRTSTAALGLEVCDCMI